MDIEKFISEVDTFVYPVCNNCKYHLGGSECAAFKRIPDDILEGTNPHTKPTLRQKNEIVFSKKNIGLSVIVDGWEDVPRAPKGSEDGGQWTSNETTTEQAELNMTGYKDKVSKETKEAVQGYTQVEYHVINDQLRNPELWEAGGGIAREIEQQKLNNNIKLLDAFIKDAPKFTGTVYRGMRFSHESELNNFLSSVSDNSILQDKGYLSTSLDISFATNFLYGSDYVVEFEIRSKKGIYLNGLSAEPREREVLFGRGSKFMVKSVEDLKNTKVSEFGQRWKRYIKIIMTEK